MSYVSFTPFSQQLAVLHVLALIIDGTATFADAEGMKIRAVRRVDWEICEPLVRCRLMEKSPDKIVLKAAIKVSIKGRGAKKQVVDVRVLSMDRCAVNGAAARLLMAENPEWKPCKIFCMSHTLSNTGLAMIGPEAIKFMKHWRKMFMHSGSHARLLFKEKTGEAVKLGGTVRWYAGWEQESQVALTGVQNVLRTIVEPCADRGYSKKSAAKLLALVDDPVVLAKVIVQIAAHAGAGCPICQATYMLETKNPIFMVAFEVLER